jgi:hypothetical protein
MQTCAVLPQNVGDTRYAGMRRVAVSVLREFVDEVSQQVYALSNNKQLRHALANVLQWISDCPAAVGCAPLLFTLMQARETAPDDEIRSAAEAGLAAIAQHSGASDSDALARQEWEAVEALAIERGASIRSASQSFGWYCIFVGTIARAPCIT